MLIGGTRVQSKVKSKVDTNNLKISPRLPLVCDPTHVKKISAVNFGTERFLVIALLDENLKCHTVLYKITRNLLKI